MKFSRLIRLLVIRTVGEEKLLTLLSVLGVALGIGLFVGVRVASDRAVASFEADIRGMNPRASHEILDRRGVDFDESVYGLVRAVEDESYPLLRATGYLPTSEETIEIIGIYTVRLVRFFGFEPGQRYDVEGYYRTLNGVFVSKSFAKKHSLSKGDLFEAAVYDRGYVFRVADVIDSDLFPAATVIMDIGNFQEYLGRSGYLTKIDLVTDDEAAQKIEGIIPPNVTIQRKEKVIENQKALVASFRYNLLFVSLIAVLVGIFLLYNTIFVSVVKRRREIGILRSLGIGKRTVMALFMIQGLILGFSIAAVEKTMSTIYRGVSITEFLLTGKDILSAMIMGVTVSLAASVIPSFESAKVRPNEALHEGSLEVRYAGYQRAFSLLGGLLIIAGAVLSYVDYRAPPFSFPYLAYGGILLFIVGFTLLSPLYLRAALRVVKSPINWLFKGTGRVAVSGVGGSVFRFSVALMSVAISTALVIALLSSIYSLRSSLKEWIERNITADIYVKPASCLSNYCFFPLTDEVIKALGTYPEVAGVDRFRVLQVELFGRNVVAGFGETEKLRQFGNVKYFKEGDRERLKRLEEKKEVSISDYLSIRHGIKKGDIIEISTPMGREKFVVNNTFISYSTTSGFIYFDRRWLRELWGLDDATQASVYLREGEDAGRFTGKLKRHLSKDYSLEILNNRELRERILAIFNRSFSITYAIELIAIVVSLLGMVNALLVLVLEKKREMSIIRYLGGSWAQIRNMIVISAGIIGMAGVLLGTVMGPIISMVIIHVINRLSFGWDVSFRVPLIPLSILTALLFVTCLSAGFLPSKVARKIDPKAFISFE
jgi:putative ABC transport system permease protein